jgi:hypothetical protein
MFKFGKYATPKGPYEQYRDPTGLVPKVGSNPATFITASAKSANRKLVTSGIEGGSNPGGYSTGGNVPGPGPSGGGGGYQTNLYNPVYDQLEEGTVLEDWIPRDASGLDLLYRRIYLRDPTIGPGIDIIRSLPWSDFTLDGIEDNEVKKIYQECMDSLNVQLLMPDLTFEFLVLGRSISSLIFDQRRGIFSGVVPHDPDFIRITPLPVYGFDPLCDFTLSPGFRKFLTNPDPRAVDARKALPSAFLDAASKQHGFLPLDPISTIYLARKAAPNDSIGTSLLTRCLYFWAIEKALLNAQLTSTRRRARSFVHLKAGIDNLWEPTSEEIDALAGLVIQANEDPVGGVIATRTGVEINEPVGGGADFYKWSDELELFAKYKMQCIGISDALLSGDATYNNAEQARSVFVESLATMRSRIVHKFFMANMFPTIARVHGFVKRSKAELDHRIRTTTVQQATSNTQQSMYKNYLRDYEQRRLPTWAKLSGNQVTSEKLTQRKAMQIPVGDLQIPTINWSKQLKPNQDEKALEVLEKLQQNEFPVTLKQWASAAGANPATMEEEQKQDLELRKKLLDLKAQIEGPQPTEGEEGEEGEELNIPEASDEIPEGEPVQQSVYSKLKKIGKGQARKLNDIAIWKGTTCGPLRKSEAQAVIASLVKNTDPAIFKDPTALLAKVQDQVGSQKAPYISYVLNRLGLARLPIDKRTAAVIARSALERINKHSNFESEKALMDVRRYQVEIQHLSRLTGNVAKIDRSALNLTIPADMGKSIFSGSSGT